MLMGHHFYEKQHCLTCLFGIVRHNQLYYNFLPFNYVSSFYCKVFLIIIDLHDFCKVVIDALLISFFVAKKSVIMKECD